MIPGSRIHMHIHTSAARTSTVTTNGEKLSPCDATAFDDDVSDSCGGKFDHPDRAAPCMCRPLLNRRQCGDDPDGRVGAHVADHADAHGGSFRHLGDREGCSPPDIREKQNSDN